MAEIHFSVLDLLGMNLEKTNELHLHCIGGRKGLVRLISTADLNRPGLALSGFFESFGEDRVQVFGQGEAAYVRKLVREGSIDSIRRFMAFKVPCCVFTHGLTPEELFIEEAEKNSCPVLQTSLSTSEFSARFMRVIANLFAPHKAVHGVLVEVYGQGILIQGDSGVGKSETALELIERGHRLVADDVVEIRCVSGNLLIGSGANKIIGHHMEIRGLGIINVTHLFGVGAIRDRKQIQMVVQLEEWDETKSYDRIGTEDQMIDILGVSIPRLDIPVKSGRNIPIIIETAAMNERLKQMGYNAAVEFNQNIMKWMESNNAKSVYFGREDII
ncbi:MAG: HPr(Ser) kinase/phosphatase [Spirochaetaceae bacterium]|jgi:HPr kinase/phosphorylase|nr:HPr(Ser) kinase/phosphatase [Spirochaetaceae bacterium]